jgi:tRNA threonylcarbamoyladenosine biosynthesis protein TsaB
MSTVLALEASAGTYAVAVGAGERPAARRAARRGDPGFAGLGALAAETLAAAGLAFSGIGLVAVDTGPGSLSSVRAAVAYANGLAFSLGVKIFPATSLWLMALEAGRAHAGPFLCLRKGEGGNAYVGLFTGGAREEMRYGPRGEVVRALAGARERVCVAGAYTGELPGLLPGVTVDDSGITEPGVLTLYAAARRAAPALLVAAATPVTEASRALHAQHAQHAQAGRGPRTDRDG